jgi:hypothetical protein
MEGDGFKLGCAYFIIVGIIIVILKEGFGMDEGTAVPIGLAVPLVVGAIIWQWENIISLTPKGRKAKKEREERAREEARIREEREREEARIRSEREEQRRQDIRLGKADAELRLELCNDTAHDLVEINVFDGSENVGNWQGQRASSIDGGRYEPVVFSLKRKYPGFFNVKVQYKCFFNNSILTAVHEEHINIEDRDMSKKIYLNHKWF